MRGFAHRFRMLFEGRLRYSTLRLVTSVAPLAACAAIPTGDRVVMDVFSSFILCQSSGRAKKVRIFPQVGRCSVAKRPIRDLRRFARVPWLARKSPSEACVRLLFGAATDLNTRARLECAGIDGRATERHSGRTRPTQCGWPWSHRAEETDPSPSTGIPGSRQSGPGMEDHVRSRAPLLAGRPSLSGPPPPLTFAGAASRSATAAVPASRSYWPWTTLRCAQRPLGSATAHSPSDFPEHAEPAHSCRARGFRSVAPRMPNSESMGPLPFWTWEESEL